MSTQVPPSQAQDLPQQEQFMKTANGFDTMYTYEQNQVAKLQAEASNMTTWIQMLGFLAGVAQLAQLMSAVTVMGDACAEAVAGVAQGAESILSSGLDYVNNMSQEVWSESVQQGVSYLDKGVPVPSLNTLNDDYATQVAAGQTFFYYLEDLTYDVSGSAFTAVDSNGDAVNPLSGIQTQVDNATQDIAMQIVDTDNSMYNNLTAIYYEDPNGQYVYTPSGTDQTPSTYAQDGNGNDYVYDTTSYMDNSQGASNPMSDGTLNQGDMFCWAMLNWSFTYASPVSYTMDGESNPTVYAPGMTENQSFYQVSTDMQTINSTTTGFAPESMPKLGFLTNLASNALAAIYNYFSDTASLNSTIIQNTNT